MYDKIKYFQYYQDDGGAPVNNYMVEMKDPRTGEWKPVSKFVRGTKYEVLGLEEGKKYEFRVSAVNDQGAGEPLICDKPIIAENQFGKQPL